MKKLFKSKRQVSALMGFGFVVLGAYNSVMVNSDAFMSHEGLPFVKRLDEIHGDVRVGRQMANAVPGGRWINLASAPTANGAVQAEEVVTVAVDAPSENPAAITTELSLELTEVFNAKKYPQGTKEFAGSLAARDGVLESISVELPQGEAFTVSSAQLTGNVFTYDIDGEDFSGMMYQMDEQSYMVTLTNGPLEGTRLKFTAAKEEEIGNNAQIAENNDTHNVEEPAQAEESFAPVVNDDGSTMQVAQFGDEVPAQTEEVAQNGEAEAPSFSFENTSATF
jgi:hypothetical protein